MNSRNWVRFFLSTLLVGGLTTGIIGFALKWSEYKELFISFNLVEIVSILFWLFGVGLIFSVISQMGFFAYLTVHRFGLGIFRSVSMWNLAQIILIVFVLFDLIYFRFQLFAEGNETILPYLLLAFYVFVVGVIIALIKRSNTNKEAFIPALFFMIVVTTIEWFPALRVNEKDWLLLMLIPLQVCNAYQLLMLPKFIKSKKS
ncbi:MULTISPECIES: KinB-signaling pathway activation protein [Metabacillus]|uniref:KinB-signaling pathway activation protein n=3 Tax=Metabacillus TaxID=2675233 RepID=A0A179SZ27_9BACI|nr:MULTISPECIES: KinB-signaling pathway activation protein [Metabacillus]OAS87017.1 KinB-signaling pathway activation protein [Metabacillus litoralis]QNF27840.1 KinB-signaling pathway activation protein [Metabacillus sp. KUDC1714]